MAITEQTKQELGTGQTSGTSALLELPEESPYKLGSGALKLDRVTSNSEAAEDSVSVVNAERAQMESVAQGKEGNETSTPKAPYGLAQLEMDAGDVEGVQESVLQEILKLHENTEYMQRYGIGGSTSIEEFKQRHPICQYDHFAEYIERESNGESRQTGKQILCAEPIIGFMLTSGSSKGTQKKIPRTTGSVMRAGMAMGLFKDVSRILFGDKPQTLLTFVHVGREIHLPGGLTAGSATTQGLSYILKHNFDQSELAKSTSPKEVFATTHATAAMYCHLLCALAARERITALRSNFLIHVVSGVRFSEKHWESFVDDLRNGTVSDAFVTDSALAAAVKERVSPQPDTASVLETDFRRDFDGILPRVFPAVTSVQAVCTGFMLQYVPAMERYAGPTVQLLSPAYNASEGLIGMCLEPNVHPLDVAYTILPRPIYWEFLPVDEAREDAREEEPVAKALHELERERSYEVVLTNFSGLVRYRLEDVVKVTGFWHGLPKVQYEYRRGTLQISAQSEKVTEKDLARGVAEVERNLPAEAGKVMDYTVAIDLKADPPRYSLFFEVEGDVSAVDDDVIRTVADAFQSSMLESNFAYVSCSDKKQLGAAEVCLVRNGTFNEFKAYKLGVGTDVAQYKVPRCLKLPEQRAIFCKGLVRSSAADCHWFDPTE